MGQKRYSQKPGIDVEAITRIVAGKNIKDALSINPPTFSTPQNIYRFGFDYNKFEPASPKNNKPVTRQVSLQYKKGKKASGIDKKTRDSLNTTYSAENERSDYVNKNYEWVRDTYPWGLGWLGNKTTSQFVPRLKEETNMQKNTIKQRIANTCYNTITARLLREGDQEPRKIPPRPSGLSDFVTGVGDTGRFMGILRAAAKFIPAKTGLKPLDVAMPWVNMALFNAQVAGLAADTANVASALTVDNPQDPKYTADTTQDALIKLAASSGALMGPAIAVKAAAASSSIGKAVLKALKGVEVPKVPPNPIKTWLVSDKGKKTANLGIQIAFPAAETLFRRTPGTIDPSRVGLVPNDVDKFQWVSNFLTKLRLPIPEIKPGSGAGHSRVTPDTGTLSPEQTRKVESENKQQRAEDQRTAEARANTPRAPVVPSKKGDN